jgi:4-hydroxybenzoate polyprenyltransferase
MVTIAWSFAAVMLTLFIDYAKCVSMPQAVLGAAFNTGIPMAFAAGSIECNAGVVVGGQPVLRVDTTTPDTPWWTVTMI